MRHFKAAQDPAVRRALLNALASARDDRGQRALELVLDPDLRLNEATAPLWGQARDARTRDRALQWLEQNFQAVLGRVGKGQMASLIQLGGRYCGESNKQRVQALFGPHAESLPGGPRRLANALESLDLCTARVAAHRAALAEFLARIAHRIP